MLACPFCPNLTPVTEEIDVGVWAVVCNTCNTIGPVENFENARQSRERAEELWDRRPERASAVPCQGCGRMPEQQVECTDERCMLRHDIREMGWAR